MYILILGGFFPLFGGKGGLLAQRACGGLLA
jgi:hypothetical protein